MSVLGLVVPSFQAFDRWPGRPGQAVGHCRSEVNCCLVLHRLGFRASRLCTDRADARLHPHPASTLRRLSSGLFCVGPRGGELRYSTLCCASTSTLYCRHRQCQAVRRVYVGSGRSGEVPACWQHGGEEDGRRGSFAHCHWEHGAGFIGSLESIQAPSSTIA